MSDPEAAPETAPKKDIAPKKKNPWVGRIVLGCGALVAIAAVFVLGMNVSRMTGGGGTGNIVVVDVSAIVNAQRAAMDADPIEGRMTVMRAGKIAEEVIRKIAGKDAVILVKQSVVALETSPVRDITDQVLEELQLPTAAAPTVRIPPVTSHLYTEQGKQLMSEDQKRTEQEKAQVRAWAEERERQDSLIP